jgi:hypothetical protein
VFWAPYDLDFDDRLTWCSAQVGDCAPAYIQWLLKFDFGHHALVFMTQQVTVE